VLGFSTFGAYEMSGKLTKTGFKKLISENINWLMQAPNCLERQHTIALLKESINYHYPSKELEQQNTELKANNKALRAVINSFISNSTIQMHEPYECENAEIVLNNTLRQQDKGGEV
jgi:hypothetical protein